MYTTVILLKLFKFDYNISEKKYIFSYNAECIEILLKYRIFSCSPEVQNIFVFSWSTEYICVHLKYRTFSCSP